MAIVKMKRLRLMGMRSERESLLHLLQKLGCVEVDEPAIDLSDPQWAAVGKPDGQGLATAREQSNLLNQALNVLARHVSLKGGLLRPRPRLSRKELFDQDSYRRGLDTAQAIVDGERELANLTAEQGKLQTQKSALAPWLSLDVPLELSGDENIAVIFGTIPARADYAAMEAAVAQASDLTSLTYASADRDLQYFLLICHSDVEELCCETMREFGFSRSNLRGWTGTAADNDRQLDNQLAVVAQKMDEAKEHIASFAPHRDALRLCLDRVAQDIAREEAKGRLVDSECAFYLEGWVPDPDVEALGQALRGYVCAWDIRAPEREEYPTVPVKLKSNRLTEPLTTITTMYSLPAYDGVDPNGLMMPFYVFFFGFMFADLGYGLILAAVTAFIQWRIRPKGGFGQLVRLMIMCGISSAVIGLLTGGFFSDFLVQFTGMLGLPQPVIPFLSAPEGSGVPGPLLNVMGDPMSVLVFSLVVGLVQIVVGMAVKFWMLCRDGKVLDAVLDVGSWWVIFVGIALFALGIGNVSGYPVVLIVGCLMLLGQARGAKGIGGKLGAVIGAVYNGVTGYFGDILSYSRLMVMMLAGSVIGQVFNILAAMPGSGLPPALGIPIFFIIFLLGHSFNIGLNVIGTYVHTSRLQYLEFFKQFYQEGGRPWRPLEINTKYVDIEEEK